jgi:hypothetical protein
MEIKFQLFNYSNSHMQHMIEIAIIINDSRLHPLERNIVPLSNGWIYVRELSLERLT